MPNTQGLLQWINICRSEFTSSGFLLESMNDCFGLMMKCRSKLVNGHVKFVNFWFKPMNSFFKRDSIMKWWARENEMFKIKVK